MIEEPKAQRVCCDCGTISPTAHTSHTLISRQHGWRLIRAPTATGETKLEWRCPACWKTYRARKTEPEPPS